MRMWLINPEYLCRQHLLGEHMEIHSHKNVFLKKHSIFGRIYPEAQIEPEAMKQRHDELAEEMIRRGMNHKRPYEMPDLSYLPKDQREAKVDRLKSLKLLLKCSECKKRYDQYNESEVGNERP